MKYNILKLVLYIIGFPALVLAVFLLSLPIILQNFSYTLMGFPVTLVGVLITVLGLVAYIVAGLITGKKAKKKGTRKSVRKGLIVMLIVAFCFTGGLWLLIDSVLPDFLADATDGTILFNDLREDYLGKGEFHGDLLDDFIEMNVNNGNLRGEHKNSFEGEWVNGNFFGVWTNNNHRLATIEHYQSQGWRNEEVRNLADDLFYSMHNFGFDSFRGPWLNLAVGERMTMEAILRLLLTERYQYNEHFQNHIAEDGNIDFKWTILDMTPEAMEVVIELPPVIANLIGLYFTEEEIDSIPLTLADFISSQNVAGAPIYVFVDIDGETGEILVSITNSNQARGTFDYMTMAWFDSNDLLLLVISLFPTRNLYFMFMGLIVLASIFIAMIREKQYVTEEAEEGVLQIEAPAPAAIVAAQTENFDDGDDEVASETETSEATNYAPLLQNPTAQNEPVRPEIKHPVPQMVEEQPKQADYSWLTEGYSMLEQPHIKMYLDAVRNLEEQNKDE